MEAPTAKLWADQDHHEGDRHRLFTAVADAIDATSALYPGSFVDLAPSFVFTSVTYVDTDPRAARFFADTGGIREIVVDHHGPAEPTIEFLAADYTRELDLADDSYDLLISLYAGFVSASCTRYLRVGGTLLVNPSHGDAAMASIDNRYRLHGIVTSRGGHYAVRTDDLDTYLVPSRPVEVTQALLRRTGRGVAYTRSPFAYLFERVR